MCFALVLARFGEVRGIHHDPTTVNYQRRKVCNRLRHRIQRGASIQCRLGGWRIPKALQDLPCGLNWLSASRCRAIGLLIFHNVRSLSHPEGSKVRILCLRCLSSHYI